MTAAAPAAAPHEVIEVARNGSARCAYCGAEYRLKPGTVLHGHH